MNNIAQADIYRVLLTALTIGLVLLNVLFGLFYYIDRLVNKSPSIKPLIISNVVLIALLSVTMAAWSMGWVESRDKRIDERAGNSSVVETIRTEEPNTLESDE